MTEFDVRRALLLHSDIFPPFLAAALHPLRDALACGDVAEDTPLLVVERDTVTLAVVARQLAYHHVAQGEVAGEPWMVSF